MNRRPHIELRQVATELASGDPMDHLVGLGRLRALEGPSRLPVLLHVLRTCDRAVERQILDWISRHDRVEIGHVLELLLDSDSVHPQSAIHYLGLVKESTFNGLMLDWLPRVHETLQLSLLQVLARTADQKSFLALGALEPRLGLDARTEARRLAESVRARRARRHNALPTAIVNRPPPVRFFPIAPNPVPLSWVSPTTVELVGWLATMLIAAPLAWAGRGPGNPFEFIGALGFALFSARILLGWPSLPIPGLR